MRIFTGCNALFKLLHKYEVMYALCLGQNEHADLCAIELLKFMSINIL